MTAGELILYKTEDGRTNIKLRAEEGMVWLTQAQIAELFGKGVPAINEHIKNIIKEGELGQDSTIRKFRIVRNEGGREVERQVAHYNLDIILAVGYRVRSQRGTQFRQWATTHLREYLVKGFLLDDARLKEPGGWDYFDELLERIRDIRASEKRFYQKVRDIYATAVDYDPQSDEAQLFFKKVQNKMLWAITGRTAAELIAGRANPSLPNMGLMSWKANRVRKQDVTIAKNYLNDREIDELNRIVVMYLDYAEDQAKRRRTTTMQEWADRLNAFLTFNERDILDHAGKVSQAVAEKLAHECYEEFEAKRREVERLEADRGDMEELGQIERNLQKGKDAERKPRGNG